MKKYIVLAAALAACPTVASAQDAPVKDSAAFDGVRVEARLGYETPTISEDGDVYKIGSAVSYGGEIGFDLALGNTVVAGPYAAYEFSSVKVCDAGDCIKEEGNLAVGGRLGVVVSPTVQIYGKVGYAQIKFSANTAFGSGSDTQNGVQGALGVAVNLGKHAYGAVELNYADYGDFYGFGLQRRHVAATVGFRF